MAPVRTEPILGGVVRIRLEHLRAGDSTRAEGIKSSYVQVLAQLNGAWPPILVDRSDHSIIDGHYRYVAARLLQHADIACVYYDGDKAQAYVEAVRRNTEHGLPLSLSERTAAAQRILELCPQWSDRRVAELCALAPGTVARVRASCTPVATVVDKRAGRDNRLRPADPVQARQRVIEAIEANPTGSLRAIARVAGSSPETVRSVRARLAAAADAPDRPPALEARPVTDDPALTATERGQEFSVWFERTGVTAEDWTDHIDSIPVSRVYELADEARRRAAQWQEFAAVLEGRVRH
jgi:ParB-like chromosome segregation protein Spo0J